MKRAASSPPTSPSPNSTPSYFSANVLSDSEHQTQDDEVSGQLEQLREWKQFNPDDPVDLGFVVSYIARALHNRGGADIKPPSDSFDYAKILKKDAYMMNIVRNSVETNSYRNVRNFAFLRNNAPAASESRAANRRAIDVTGATATLKSWEEAYVGSAADSLWDTLTKHCEINNSLTYARYLSIVQSSGMGKSRMVDELAKKHFVIPLNLRPKGDSGFPPADVEARDFLIAESLTGQNAKTSTHIKCHAFLFALFETCAAVLGNIESWLMKYVGHQSPGEPADRFRRLMTAGQEYREQGPARREFYSLVCKRANVLFQSVTQEDLVTPTASPRTPPQTEVIPSAFSSPSRPVKFPKTEESDEAKLVNAAQSLLRALNDKLDMQSAGLSKLPPMVVIASDEAHVMSDKPVNEDWTIFSEFRRTLRVLNRFPFFALFLSTTGKIEDFTPPAENDKSKRLENRELQLLAPFTELGFDQMIQPRLSEGSVTIDDVSTLEYMAMHGRPLFGARYKHAQESVRSTIAIFAAEKLIGGRDFPTTPEQIKNLDAGAKLACMAVRLALEFNATTLGSRVKEREQVEKHMRVCLTVNQGFETAVTIAPSEPLLAEGAFLIMKEQDEFDLPFTLLKELEGPGLDKGDRGELICLVLLTLARDMVAKQISKAAIPLLDFVQSLLAHDWHKVILGATPTKSRCAEERNRSFKETFAQSRIYFNHFIKVHDFKVINRRFLWALKSRGAAVLCANNQSGVDVVLPFVYRDAKLQHDNISAILIQVKNDKRYMITPNLFLFDAMNPYFLGFFNMDEVNPLPIIRMVFALASDDAGVEVIEPTMSRRNPSRSAKRKKKTVPPFTTYDIWCAGASMRTFAVINARQETNGTYQSLLKVGNIFPGVYGAQTTVVSAISGRRNMNPGAANHPDHWSRFVWGLGGAEEQVDRTDYDFDVDMDVDMDTKVQL